MSIAQINPELGSEPPPQPVRGWDERPPADRMDVHVVNIVFTTSVSGMGMHKSACLPVTARLPTRRVCHNMTLSPHDSDRPSPLRLQYAA